MTKILKILTVFFVVSARSLHFLMIYLDKCVQAYRED